MCKNLRINIYVFDETKLIQKDTSNYSSTFPVFKDLTGNRINRSGQQQRQLQLKDFPIIGTLWTLKNFIYTNIMVASISIGVKAWKAFQFSSEFQGEAIIQFSIHYEISWEKSWKPEYSKESQREMGWQNSRIKPSEHSYLKSKKIHNEKKADMASECNLKYCSQCNSGKQET